MSEEKDTHRKLLDTFYEYFKVNQVWEIKETHTAGLEARKLLSEIRRLASLRRKEIQEVRLEKPRVKSPYYVKPETEDDDDNDD